MSRPLRAGSAGRNVTIRASEAERAEWLRCARGAGQTMSEWLRSLANNEARETAVRRARRQRT